MTGTLRRELLQSFAYLYMSSRFYECSVDVIWILNLLSFFIILPGTSIEYVIKLAYIQCAYICALRYLFWALPQVSYDINDLHRLKFHT